MAKPGSSRSLGTTLESISEALFFGTLFPTARQSAAAKWIARRQGLPGAYAGMFAPTKRDWRGLRLFTGEPVRSRAGISHQLGEEGCRILWLLQMKDAAVQGALRRAIEGMTARLDQAEREGNSTGLYCCGTCSAGYWRNLALGLFPRAEERLGIGLERLRELRLGDGEWKRFPFYYTSLALTEIGPALARAEMQYAAPRWETLLPRLSRSTSRFARRRAAVGRRLLELCNR